ncbi:hypothetical protein PTKIN_Ptkin19aG0090600 [Pterospermum kingtungense]
MGFLFFSLFSAIVVSLLIFHAANASNVTYDSRAFLIDGNRRILITGSIHYPRSTAQKEMEKFTKFIVDMVKKEKLFAPQGGPIILSQIENEYGLVIDQYGKAYINWCAQMIDSLNIGVPWLILRHAMNFIVMDSSL